ncbi:hypothetical protein AKJ38_03070 [candidate division MSBL1 archaeon SCGC-AAA259I14]|uniref:DOD-type homing endonuclease domain-containing protein n=1 Tax=candidate division MSBL1 archaeon SCGC-AAA259I14 TaxID=1698268 RepID=A0A133UQY7_9EURY|nr:hypothetical protein AKJ38_03070 [candidate division MSBL1 archaeon SCGC-AAA259I14]
MSDGIHENIKFDENGNFVSDLNLSDEQRKEIIRMYRQEHSSYKIAEKFDVSQYTVLKVLREEGCEIRSRGSKKGTKPPNYVERDIPDPWNNVDAAYVFGVLIGDASIEYNYREGERKSPQSITLHTPDREFRNELSGAVKSAFKIRTAENPNGKKKRVKIGTNSVDLAGAYDKFKWRLETWQVPKPFFNAPEEIRVALCQGKFDSDGTVDKKAIVISSVYKPGLKDLQKIVESLGFETSLPGSYEYNEENWEDRYKLRILDASSSLFRLSRKRTALQGEDN